MKRVLTLVLILVCLCANALANDYIYIANPNPADRLHLRAAPDENADSLGRYYNGAPIQRLYFSHAADWVHVRVGLGSRSLTGYMKREFLSDESQTSAMPQYAAIKPVKAYEQPVSSAKQITIAGGRLISLMGFSDGWWHVMAHTGTGEGNYTCFVPANESGLISLTDGMPVNAYISNPDPADRLHLRTAPSQKAKSMGKYYNGTVGTLKGFSEDGEWLRVELYGRTGYMMSKFITIEGKTNRTRYGMPTAHTLRQSRLYRQEEMKGEYKTVPADTAVEILGIVDQNRLHVQLSNTVGYMLWKDVDYVDPK